MAGRAGYVRGWSKHHTIRQDEKGEQERWGKHEWRRTGEGERSLQSNKQLESIHRVLSPFSVRTTLSPLLEPTLDTGFIWGESPTRLLKPIHPCILPRPEEMVLRGVEIPAPPRASPEILENTDLEAPPWESTWGRLEQKLQKLLKAPWGTEARTQAHPDLKSHGVLERSWRHNPTPSREQRIQRTSRQCGHCRGVLKSSCPQIVLLSMYQHPKL